MISAHELGHAIVWRDEKLPPATLIEVRGAGRTAKGQVYLKGSHEIETADFARSCLIGLLAGVEAGNWWREIHAPQLDVDESATDRRRLRQWMALPAARRLGDRPPGSGAAGGDAPVGGDRSTRPATLGSRVHHSLMWRATFDAAWEQARYDRRGHLFPGPPG
jgi:hypothetical protein